MRFSNMAAAEQQQKESNINSIETIKSIFSFKSILKTVAISGIFVACFYVTVSIYFSIIASFRGLSFLNAIFGGISFLTFIYFYFAIHSKKKVYYYNVFVIFIVMNLIVFLMALINLMNIKSISETVTKLCKSQNYFNDIKNDIDIQYFINACMSILLCCYMIFSMIFVEKGRQTASGYDQPDLRNPARSTFFMMALF